MGMGDEYSDEDADEDEDDGDKERREVGCSKRAGRWRSSRGSRSFFIYFCEYHR